VTDRLRRLLPATLVALLSLGTGADEAAAWGGRTHEIVNRRAVDLLPEPARSAWLPLASSLASHAGDADHRKSTTTDEPPRHYIDIDFYGKPPFDDVPRDLGVLKRKHGAEAVAKWGVAPWAVEECWTMLVRSLEVGDWGSAGAWAADLGHYVADTHQPLHCTMNYDGQRTGNRGIHLRFEVRMMDRHYREEVLDDAPPVAAAGEDPLESCFAWIAEAYDGLGPLLEGDDAAAAVDPRHGDRYYEILWERTGAVAETQVRRATEDLAALWLSAWEAAGSPPGPPETPDFRPLPADLLVEDPGGRTAGRRALVLAGGVLLGALVLAGS
jgi:hypothetical protein